MPERLVQDDCELRALAVEEPLERSLSKRNDYTETYLETSTGRILVAHTEHEITNSKPVIITYHDLGLNYVSNFQAFFNYPEFKVRLRMRCVVLRTLTKTLCSSFLTLFSIFNLNSIINIHLLKIILPQ